MQDNKNRASSINTSPTRKPKKGILKNSNMNNRRSIATTNASDLIYINSSPSAQSAAKTSYNKRMTFDEMNILATYHPPDKDYGFDKIDEPKTPFKSSDNNMSDDESNDTGVDALKLEEKLNTNRKKLPKYMQDKMNLSDDDDENELLKRNPKFESQRKMHYNEFQMAQLLKSRFNEEEEDDDDVNTKKDEKLE